MPERARPAPFEPFALAGALAALELLWARVTAGPLGGVELGGALAAAATFAVLLRGLRAAPGALRGIATGLVVSAYGAAALAPPFVGLLDWRPLAIALGTLVVSVAAWRGGLGCRGALVGLSLHAALGWGLLAGAGIGVPSPGRLALVSAATAAALALGRRAALLAPLALLPSLAPEAWSARGPAPPSPDVLLISVDTLRLDTARQMRSVRGLAEAGRLYAAQASSPWTLPSLATLLTGVVPARHGAGRGADGLTRLAAGVQTLAERLSARGYDTAATVHSPFADPAFGLRQGFARFRGELVDAWVLPGIAYANRARPLGATLLDAAGAIETPTGAAGRIADVRAIAARRRERPLFLWVHLLDPHIPYRHAGELELPASSRALLATARRSRLAPLPPAPVLSLLRRGYAHEVEVVDAAIEAILEALPPGRHGRIVVLTADHGEEFGEHGGWEHGHTFYQELLAVPLVIEGIPRLRGEEAGLVDVVPTLVAALGAPDAALDGRDLSSPPERVPYGSVNPLYGELRRRAVKLGPRKLVDGRAGLVRFDLGSDPGEQIPLPAAPELRALLPPPLATGSALRLRAEQKAALRALGYLEE